MEKNNLNSTKMLIWCWVLALVTVLSLHVVRHFYPAAKNNIVSEKLDTIKNQTILIGKLVDSFKIKYHDEQILNIQLIGKYNHDMDSLKKVISRLYRKIQREELYIIDKKSK